MGDTLKKMSQHFGDNVPLPIDIENELSPPDTALCEAATEMSKSLCKPSIFKHSMRTFMFGLCIGKHLEESSLIDREQFYISCILHQIGFSDEIRDLEGNKGRDMELIGADHAYSFLNAQGYERRKAEEVHEAIALHSHVGIIDDREPQLSLLYKGSVLDLVGNYMYHVRGDVITNILEKYPRDHFAVEFRDLLHRELEEKPMGSSAYDCLHGLDTLIMHNPMDQKRTDFPL